MRFSIFSRPVSFAVLRGAIVALWPLALALDLNAQSAASDADRDWQALQDRLVPAANKTARAGVMTATATVPNEKAALIAQTTAVADQAQAFRARYPKDARAGAASVIEARELLKAALLGDTSRAARTDSAVSRVEADKTLPSKSRFEIVALSEHLLLRKVAKSSAEAQVARETSARYLMQSFPRETGGYLALVGAADATSDRKKVAAVAAEIERSAAPFAAKGAARVAAGRHALVGKSLADVANTALGRGNFFEAARRQRVVLYTWASWSPNSVAYAKTAFAKLPKDVLVLGYNLDRDVAAARALAAREKLPGRQYYDATGIGSRLSMLLFLNTAPLVYATDEKGVIIDVAGQRRDLAAFLSFNRTN